MVTDHPGAVAVLRCMEGAPQDVAALAATLDLHPNTVRKHLLTLERAGLVQPEVEHRGRPGRPRRTWAVATGAVADVARATTAHGMKPFVDGSAVTVHRCPFRPSGPGAAVCALHIAAVEDAALAHGATVTLTMHDGPPCRFDIQETP